MKFERAEREILRVLQDEGRISNVELAERIGLSESPCFRRVKKLEDEGVIAGYRAVLDQREIGLQVIAFVQVSMDQQDDAKQREFLACVEAEDHIIECHAVSGGYDYLLKVVDYSMDHFSELCMQRILKFPGVKSIESHFSLKTLKQSGSLPLR